MARLARTQLPDGIYHVFTKGVEGCDVFRDERDRVTFLELLRACGHRFRWRCYALCLMTTHYHLVIATTRKRLSDGHHLLNGIYAQRFNRRYAREGHLFGRRFGSRVVEDEQYLYRASYYVVENPVRAGLCDRWEDWPWSFLSADLRPQSEHLFPSADRARLSSWPVKSSSFTVLGSTTSRTSMSDCRGMR